MGSVSCRIYPKCHQILKVMMLVFYFFHHLWLTNRDGFDFVRGVSMYLDPGEGEGGKPRRANGFYLYDYSPSPHPRNQPHQPLGEKWVVLGLL